MACAYGNVSTEVHCFVVTSSSRLDTAREARVERPGAGSIAWQINGERASVLGWGRAILLQLSHPLVAAGVGAHSGFRENAWASVARFRATLRAMLALTFGTDAEARAAVSRIRGVHDRVHGTVTQGTPRHPAGSPYSAHDPDLLAWVNLTLLDSMPMAYERTVAPLDEHARTRYALESRWSAELIGARPDDLPSSAGDVRDQMRVWLEGGWLEVTDQSRALAHAIVWPSAGWLGGPFAELHVGSAIGWLPEPLRDAYGFRWSADDARVLERWERRVRWWSRHAPAAARRWRAARRAERRVAQNFSSA